MKKSSLSIALTLLLGIFLFTSCSKEGPTGPQGENGAAGPGGPAGPAGPAGASNVIYSDWFDLPYTVVKNDAGDTLRFQALKSVPDLTKAILDNGEIKVYVNINSIAEPIVVPLPADDLFFGVLDAFSITPYFAEQQILFYATDDASTYNNSQIGKTYQYRYVLIPGGVAATSSVNWNNYDEVKKALKLKD